MTKMSEENKWYMWYVGSSWLTNFGHGMVVTVVGPTQPYLAQNVGVDIDVINLVWTFGFFGYMIGALLAGFIFRTYCVSNAKKMAFLSVTMAINGLFMIVLPLVDNFGALVFFRCVQNVSLGAFITADMSLIVYTMGPIKSRPFTMALHSLIGAGFLTATFLVGPFLPEDDTSKNSDDVCNGTTNNTVEAIAAAEHNEKLYGLNKIAWPFLISGLWCVVFSGGYAILGCLRYKMPRYYEDIRASENYEAHTSRPRVHHWKPILVITFFYYLISCGIERIYQPMAYTYGLCGPLKLAPSAAVVTDRCYNGGFMGGRISSIFVAKILKPRNMVIVSLVACLAASSLLVAIGGNSVIGLYVGTCLLGFFVSWQFGSCYSWIAQKGDITGRLAPLFLIGCGSGGVIFPPTSGFVFTSSWGPDGILQLTLITCVVQCGLYATMWSLSKKPAKFETEVEMEKTLTTTVTTSE